MKLTLGLSKFVVTHVSRKDGLYIKGLKRSQSVGQVRVVEEVLVSLRPLRLCGYKSFKEMLQY